MIAIVNTMACQTRKYHSKPFYQYSSLFYFTRPKIVSSNVFEQGKMQRLSISLCILICSPDLWPWCWFWPWQVKHSPEVGMKYPVSVIKVGKHLIPSSIYLISSCPFLTIDIFHNCVETSGQLATAS